MFDTGISLKNREAWKCEKLLGVSYLPRILQEAQTDREQQNLISGYIQNPDTTDEENTESTTDEPEEETDPNMERIVDFQNLQPVSYTHLTLPTKLEV